MGKKKRIRKITIFGCAEGDREQKFLSHLRNIYRPEDNNIALTLEKGSGGDADRIVTAALRESHRNYSFAWLDEDFEPAIPLSDDVRQRLARCWNIKQSDIPDFMVCPLKDLQIKYNHDFRNPVVIVSFPVCVEAVILQCLGVDLPVVTYDHKLRTQQINTLKGRLEQLFDGKKEEDFYKDNLSKEVLEKNCQTIVQLKMLITMLNAV